MRCVVTPDKCQLRDVLRAQSSLVWSVHIQTTEVVLVLADAAIFVHCARNDVYCSVKCAEITFTE